MLPHDLLPITRPLEEINLPSDTSFYDNVVKALIPDIVQMEANGIPIDLTKVSVLEDTVTNVLDEVYKKLANNELMLKFLRTVTTQYKKDKAEELEAKKKTSEDFIKPFDIKNKVHRSYAVNTYLLSIDRKDMCMEEWSVKDLRKLNQILASNFLQALLDKTINSSMEVYITSAMEALAKDKADIYNKNKIGTKIEQLQEQDIIHGFNPGSPTQKQNFFKFYGIESEKETKTGNPQWDRAELERLQKLINIMIDEKGESHESES